MPSRRSFAKRLKGVRGAFGLFGSFARPFFDFVFDLARAFATAGLAGAAGFSLFASVSCPETSASI